MGWPRNWDRSRSTCFSCRSTAGPRWGVPGNMTAAEAVGLASRAHPRYLVPHYYDMFTFNTVAVEVFEAEARRLPAAVEPRILRLRWEIKK